MSDIGEEGTLVAASLPKWKKLMDDRKQTAGQIITMASTRNTLTEDQQAAIRKLEAESTGEAA